MHKVLIVGAGMTGCVIARVLAESGVYCDVIDSRNHVAGNCYSARDPATGIMVHKYGPHIFHTDQLYVWNWIRRFGEFKSYRHRVFATANGRVFGLPINLHTLNQFFGSALSPVEARELLVRLTEPYKTGSPSNFEEQALSSVGRELYEVFFKGYTEKQWGLPSTEIPGEIFKRLPLRFDYDDSYFNHAIQGIPVNGYTKIAENILSHPNIDVSLGVEFDYAIRSEYDHTFYSGQVDRFFGFSEGRLPYRTLDFEELRSDSNFQGCAVMNYCDADVPWTRITEHKHFAPWESHDQSVYYRELSRECGEYDVPYYPVNLAAGSNTLAKYRLMADREPDVTFVGRLGAFKYMDMDIAIADALAEAKRYLELRGPLR